MNSKSKDVREALVEALSQSTMLRFLGKSAPRRRELREMLETGEIVHYSAGDVIIQQGDESDGMYMLGSGAVEISLEDSVICVLDKPGEVFGEFGTLTGELRSATVKARDDVSCLAVSMAYTNRKAQEENGMFYRLILQAFAKTLLGRLRHSNEEVVELRKALVTAENQVSFLRIDNDLLKQDLKSARAEIKAGK